MAVKKVKLTKEQITEKLGFEPTDEQLAKMGDFEIEVEVSATDDFLKTEVDAIKAKTIKERFKRTSSQKTVKPVKPVDEDEKDEDKLDIAKIKAEAIKEAQEAAKISSFISINGLDDEQATDFQTLINSQIKAGKTVEEAISAKKSLFVKETKKVSLTDFGSPVSSEDIEQDEISRELDKYIKK